MKMRLLIATGLLLALATSARADDGVTGIYDIKIDEMADNCTPPPVTLANKTVRIDVKANSLTVNLDTIPQLSGAASKTGRISAKTPKALPTTFGGLDGKYSIAGHVAADKSIELVLVAEYSRSDTKKPYCTQSWTLTGKKSGAAAAPPTK